MTGLVSVAALFAACGRGPDIARAVASQSDKIETAAPGLADRAAEVAQAYRAANRAFVDAAAIPDPDLAAVRATQARGVLAETVRELWSLKAGGLAMRHPAQSKYRVTVTDVDVEGDSAHVVACIVDDAKLVDVASGFAVDTGVFTVRATGTLERLNGTWKLVDQRQEVEPEGATTCPN